LFIKENQERDAKGSHQLPSWSESAVWNRSAFLPLVTIEKDLSLGKGNKRKNLGREPIIASEEGSK